MTPSGNADIGANPNRNGSKPNPLQSSKFLGRLDPRILQNGGRDVDDHTPPGASTAEILERG